MLLAPHASRPWNVCFQALGVGLGGGVGGTTGLQALFSVLPGHSEGKEAPLAGPTDLLVYLHHFLLL